jgi:predicted RNase H-like nuclease
MMSRIAAVVGSKAGWFVLRETTLPGPWSWFVTETFEEAMRRLEGCEVVTVDAPLGLTAPEAQPGDEAPGRHGRYRRPVEKVREVREFMRANSDAAHLLYEVHPHVSMLELQGGYDENEHNGGGPHLLDQLRYLCDVYPSEALYDALSPFRPADVSRRDVLDAFAMLWSAKRIATSRAERLPSRPVHNARGYEMAVWY